jgi:predicted nucleic acid-binding protein
LPRRRDLVVVDTSVWLPFLKGRRAPHSDALKLLLRSGEAAVTGIVVAEVLQGASNAAEERKLEHALSAAVYLSIGHDGYRAAGRLSAALRRGGRSVQLSDVLVATAAIAHGVPILTADSDYGAIPGVQLYRH